MLERLRREQEELVRQRVELETKKMEEELKLGREKRLEEEARKLGVDVSLFFSLLSTPRPSLYVFSVYIHRLECSLFVIVGLMIRFSSIVSLVSAASTRICL